MVRFWFSVSLVRPGEAARHDRMDRPRLSLVVYYFVAGIPW